MQALLSNLFTMLFNKNIELIGIFKQIIKFQRIASPARSKLSVCTLLAAGLTGCAHTTVDLIERSGLHESVITGTTYRHVVLSRQEDKARSKIHVYIGSDGSPWTNGQVPSNDPTPRNPLTIKLMLLDDYDVVFVGRPCYFGLAEDRNCKTSDWTFGRYSGDIVSSMASVIRQLVVDGQYGDVVVIGYSGGGALARLVAPGIPNLVGLLTIAGNLDTDAWTDARGFLPLTQSLNPANQAPLAAKVLHVQAIGKNDTIVPQSVTNAYQAKGHNVQVWSYEDFDHVCCWIDEWQSILSRFESSLSGGRHVDQ
jgi:hypothetical protein